jgi:hypothetical protein
LSRGAEQHRARQRGSAFFLRQQGVPLDLELNEGALALVETVRKRGGPSPGNSPPSAWMVPPNSVAPLALNSSSTLPKSKIRRSSKRSTTAEPAVPQF